MRAKLAKSHETTNELWEKRSRSLTEFSVTVLTVSHGYLMTVVFQDTRYLTNPGGRDCQY